MFEFNFFLLCIIDLIAHFIIKSYLYTQEQYNYLFILNNNICMYVCNNTGLIRNPYIIFVYTITCLYCNKRCWRKKFQSVIGEYLVKVSTTTQLLLYMKNERVKNKGGVLRHHLNGPTLGTVSIHGNATCILIHIYIISIGKYYNLQSA